MAKKPSSGWRTPTSRARPGTKRDPHWRERPLKPKWWSSGCTLTNLYNERPAWLDLAHKKLDAAVAAAYGWPPDLSDDQILECLLALNLARAAKEAQSAAARNPKTRRAKHHDELV